MHSGTFVMISGRGNEGTNPSHALQVMRPFLEKAVLVVQSQQANLKIPSVMARVPWPTVVISLYSKKCEVK